MDQKWAKLCKSRLEYVSKNLEKITGTLTKNGQTFKLYFSETLIDSCI